MKTNANEIATNRRLSQDCGVELTEKDLALIAAGVRKAGGTQMEYLTYTMSTVFVSN